MKLLLAGTFSYTPAELELLKSLDFRIDFLPDEQEKLLSNPAEYEAIVCNALFLYHDIHLFNTLKFVQSTSAGTERIPMDYLKQNNIGFHNARGVYSIPMAEWTIGKILEIHKSSRFFYRNQSQSQWMKNRNLLELSGKKALIVGLGSAGLEIAKRLTAFDVIISGVDIREKKSAYIHHFYSLDKLDTLLPDTDILILTLPLNDTTYHLLNDAKLGEMKENAVLINISRGAVIDEQSLIRHLQSGKFLGVALDVFEEEPLPAASPLWQMENVIATPHNSFISEKNHERLFQLIYTNLQNFIAKNER